MIVVWCVQWVDGEKHAPVQPLTDSVPFASVCFQDATGIEVAERIDQMITELCAASPAPRLDTDQGSLAGTWQLLYSSELVPGNTKFAGNWPFLANSDVLRQFTKPLLPKIVDVQQEIDVAGGRLDNVVTLELRPPVLAEVLSERVGPAPVVVARLEHDYRISGAATVTITFDKTTVRGNGGWNGWLDNAPELSWGGEDNVLLGEIREATRAYNSSSFDVIYLDATLRVTRADRGEVRVFWRR